MERLVSKNEMIEIQRSAASAVLVRQGSLDYIYCLTILNPERGGTHEVTRSTGALIINGPGAVGKGL
jgi:hypothetical protein